MEAMKEGNTATKEGRFTQVPFDVACLMGGLMVGMLNVMGWLMMSDLVHEARSPGSDYFSMVDGAILTVWTLGLLVHWGRIVWVRHPREQDTERQKRRFHPKWLRALMYDPSEEQRDAKRSLQHDMIDLGLMLLYATAAWPLMATFLMYGAARLLRAMVQGYDPVQVDHDAISPARTTLEFLDQRSMVLKWKDPFNGLRRRLMLRHMKKLWHEEYLKGIAVIVMVVAGTVLIASDGPSWGMAWWAWPLYMVDVVVLISSMVVVGFAGFVLVTDVQTWFVDHAPNKRLSAWQTLWAAWDLYLAGLVHAFAAEDAQAWREAEREVLGRTVQVSAIPAQDTGSTRRKRL